MDIKTIQFMCATFDSPDDFLATLLNSVGLNPDKYNDGERGQLEEPISKGLVWNNVFQ